MENEVPAPAPDLPMPSRELIELAAPGPAPAGDQAPVGEGPMENRFWEHSNGRPKGSIAARTQITHDAIIDYMIAKPRARRKDIALEFGFKSEQSISIIMNSDSFQARMARRKTEIIDPVMTACLEDRLRGLAATSAEIVADALEREPQNTKLAMEVLKVTRAGEYGSKAQVAVQTNFVMHLPGPASSSSEWRERFAPADAQMVQPRLEEAPSEPT